MLKEQEKKLLFNVSIISIVLCLIVCIPFGKTNVTGFDLVFKYIIAPILIVVATILNFNVKYRNYRPANRFATIASYMPIFSYILAIFFYTLLCLVRDGNIDSGWIASALIVTVVMVAFGLITHLFYRAVIVFSKNSAMLVDGAIVLFMVIDVIFLSSLVKGYRPADSLANGTFWHIFLTIIFGVLGVVLHALSLRNYMYNNDEYKLVPKEQLLKEWMELRETEYSKAEEVILQALYDFSKEQVCAEDASDLLAKIDVLEAEKESLLAQLEEYKNMPEPVAEEPVAEVKVEQDDSKFMELYERLIKVQEELTEAQKEVVALSKRLEEERKALAEKEVAPAPVIIQPAPIIQEDPHLAKKVAEVEVREEKLAEKEKLISERNALVQEKLERLQQEKEMTEEEKNRLEQEIAEKEAEIARRDEEERLAKEEEERLQREAEEAARIAAEEKEKRDKALYKAIRPVYEKVVAYIDAFEGVRNVAGANGRSNKFFIGKKLFLIMQKGNTDYRVIFLAADNMLLKYMKLHADCVNRFTGQPGTNWLKFTNKTVMEEEFVKEIVKGSFDYVQKQIADELAAKEKARLEKEEAKRKAREAAKEAARKQKEAEKAKAAKEAEKAKAKEAAKAKNTKAESKDKSKAA